jgi:uncharacterized protein with ParB-like and HNH nuclease domain
MSNEQLEETAAETKDREWYEDRAEQEPQDDYPIDQYDLTATPNDFNILTIFNFIQSGAVKIPGFQRNFVWDLRRASKLVESLIIGLPVPQVFLYEESRNKFLVIDGQQRLMSIYYYMTQRFPRKEKRPELRRIFEEHGQIPEAVLEDDKYFSKFNLRLPETLPGRPSKFAGLNYATLGDYKTAFELRPIRNIIVKQVSPKDDDSAIYEIFNRLNSGGMNLAPQEIRTSLYHSDFYAMLYRANTKTSWRRLLGLPEPDLHMKDIEILLRGFAMLIHSAEYSPSMVKFLNAFSKNAKSFGKEVVAYFETLFDSFLESCADLSQDAFFTSTNRFSVMLFDTVFASVCADAYAGKRPVRGKIVMSSLVALKSDAEFSKAAERSTTDRENVATRLHRAKATIQLS